MTDSSNELLLTFLTGRDFECPVCSYNLRDLRTQLCPECGTELRLQVGAVEPRKTACIAGLLGLTAGAGFSGLLVVYVGVRLLIDRHGGPPDRFVALTVIPLIIQTSLLIVWLKNWRRIRRVPRHISGLLVMGSWAITLLNVVLFATHIR